MATQPQPEFSVEVQRIPPQSTEMIVSLPPTPQLALQRAPEIVLQEAAKAASALKDVIERKPNKVVINGKTFLTFEDWQTLGRFYGVTVAARATSYIEQGRVRGYECHAEATRADGQVIGAAQAMCMDDEPKWSDKPLYQLRSMAQTRAQAKALRGVLAWVAVLAGYSPTPAEEMDGNTRNFPSNSSKSEGISRDQLEQGVNDLRTAQNREQLRKIFTFWYRKATTANDHRAQAVFIQVKDTRKAALL